MSYSASLQHKIDTLKARMNPGKLGSIDFQSPLLLAPMSAICNAPFRLFMQELGAGLTVSELISCHGINYGNEKTKHMLKILPEEKNIGIQLFGEDKDAMAKAAKVAQDYGPKFIDINMGCPVRKVVSKGGGSALMKDPRKLGEYFAAIKKAITIPLTIKIRTGWDENSRNAHEIIHIAHNEGVEFVAIHGRTRAQKYKGKADWEYLENLIESSPLPLIGNGDLHSASQARHRLQQTKFPGLMLGRGPLRNPFLFLETYRKEDESHLQFSGSDYWEICQRLYELTEANIFTKRTLIVQIRKFIVWFSTGFTGASQLRQQLFTTQDINEVMALAKNFFVQQQEAQKQLNHDRPFMMGGHG